jgi:hypothetical protein
MANRYVAMAVGAVLAAGSVGTGVYVANTQHDARVAMGAAHDVTTRHGEIAVRVDAGGAGVTALAAVSPGTPTQVLTVGDSGVPVWRDPAGSTAPRAYVTADLTPVQGHANTSASIVDGRLRLSIDAAVRRYGTVSGTWTTTAPRGVLTLPSGAREVLAITRVYTGSGTATSYIGVSTLLRDGSDPSDVTGSSLLAGTRLAGALHWDTAAGLYGGEHRADTYPVSTGLGVVAWASAPTPYYGIRWTRGVVAWAAAPTTATTIDDVVAYGGTPLAPDWAAPTQLVVTLQQYTGGAIASATIDVEVLVWVWT